MRIIDSNFNEMPEFTTMKALAERLGLCYRSVFRAVRDGRIKSIRFGGAVKIPAQEVSRILKEGF